jgi:hypothetical protein
MQLKLRVFAIYFIGIYQLLGGFDGIYKLFETLIGQSLLYWIADTLFIVPFIIISLVAAFYLLFYPEKTERGVRFTYINQLCQFIHFKIFGIGLYYVSGMFFDFGFAKGSNNLIFYKEFSPFNFACSLSLNSADKNYILINVIPVVIIAMCKLIDLKPKNSNYENV